jgi:hypothetical protein
MITTTSFGQKRLLAVTEKQLLVSAAQLRAEQPGLVLAGERVYPLVFAFTLRIQK